METAKVGMLVLLSISIAAVISGTASMGLIGPVFAGHDHGDQKCKNNDDNNCNSTHKTQKIKAKNECEIENNNKDKSKDNTNVNDLACVNVAANLKDVVVALGGTDSLFGNLTG